MWLILLLIYLITLIYYYVIKPTRYWKDRNVTFEKPLPLFGSMLPAILGKMTNSDVFQNIYNKFPNDRYVGVFNFANPILLIRDPELIKTITVKEFRAFSDRRPFLPDNVDRLWNRNLFAIKGYRDQKWQKLRSTISPAFTTTKMKSMLFLMKQCSKQFLEHLSKKGDFTEIELKEAFTQYGNDVIASTAFGVTCDSFSDADNEFYVMSRDLNNLTGLKRWALTFHVFATIAKCLNISIFSKKACDFFKAIVKKSMKLRREKSIVRLDVLHLLMEAQKGNLNYEENNEIPDAGFAVVEESEMGKLKANQIGNVLVDDETITAQVMILIIGGTDTTSTHMAYVLYELALNPDVQERLRREVDNTLEKSNFDITYETLMGMKYLDMVISEVLRKWPPFIVLDRKSVKPFTIEPKHPGEQALHLSSGSFVTYSVLALHMDPKYFPDPDKFDPERFSEENKHKIQPYTYIPFGCGPRGCVASRFALLKTKLIITELIGKYEIVAVRKTLIPMVMSKSHFIPIPDEGIWVGFKRRK
ncbi:hypothetical protein FQA39_LY16037 [Lamprigera yunnana]|nr:hypothetical protein FQA39_LY16037 [Lamprigera yunnana]